MKLVHIFNHPGLVADPASDVPRKMKIPPRTKYRSMRIELTQRQATDGPLISFICPTCQNIGATQSVPVLGSKRHHASPASKASMTAGRPVNHI